MTEPKPTYKAEVGYQLTEAEEKIIKWIRRGSENGHWSGTIQYYSDTCIYQLADHTKAGQVKR